MDHHDDKNESTSQQTDLSKAQNQQQPQGQQGQSQQTEGQSQQQPSAQHGQSQQSTGQSQQQQPQGQADYGSAGQGAGHSDTAGQQRSDGEDGTSTGQASNESNSQFVGSKGASDTSSEFAEDDESSDFAKDGQGTAE